jgi:hypothetical protein
VGLEIDGVSLGFEDSKWRRSTLICVLKKFGGRVKDNKILIVS